MKDFIRILTLIGLWLIFPAAPAAAHHAFAAMYDASTLVKLRGNVTKIELVNPHSWIYINVAKSDGKVEQWMIEAAGAGTLLSRGYSRDSLKLGTEITVDGYLSKDGALRVNGRDLTLPTGQVLFVGSTGTGAPYDKANAAQAVQEYQQVIRGQVAGAWWMNAALMQRLGITDDQKAKIERTFENHRLAIVSTTDSLEKEEAQLARLLETEPIDRNAVLTQIDRVVQARSEVERANAAMTLEMREHLTRAQWLQLPRTNVTISPAAGAGRNGGPVSPSSPSGPGQRRGPGQ
jgi:Spy/CpxP family protein refolding chaperone